MISPVLSGVKWHPGYRLVTLDTLFKKVTRRISPARIEKSSNHAKRRKSMKVKSAAHLWIPESSTFDATEENILDVS